MKKEPLPGCSLINDPDQYISKIIEDDLKENPADLKKYWLRSEENREANHTYKLNFQKYIRVQKLIRENRNAFEQESISPRQNLEKAYDLCGTVIDEFFLKKIEEKKAKLEEEGEPETTIGHGPQVKDAFKHENASLIFKYDPFFIRTVYEIIQEFSLQKKSTSVLLLKLIRRYLELIENAWLTVVDRVLEETARIKKERDFLLGKHFKIPSTQQIQSLTENFSVSRKNLISHKQMIYTLVGRVYEQEHKCYIAKIENKTINEDMHFWINNWDNVRSNPYLKSRLDAVKFDELQDFHLQSNKSIKDLSREEFSVLVSAERMLKALNFKNRWQLKHDLLLEKFKNLKHDFKELKSNTELQDALNIDMSEKLKDSQYFVHKLERENKELRERLIFTSTSEACCQTKVAGDDMNFVLSLEHFVKRKEKQEQKKIMKIIKRVADGSSIEKPLHEKETLELIAHLYGQKIIELTYNHFVTPHDINDKLFQAYSKRYSSKHLVKQKCEQFVLSIRHMSERDERIKIFTQFFGASDTFPNLNMLSVIFHFYVKSLKGTGESVELLLGQEAEIIKHNIELLLSKLQIIFPHAPTIIKEKMRKRIVYESDCEEHKISVQQKYSLGVLNLFLAQISSKLSFHDYFELILRGVKNPLLFQKSRRASVPQDRPGIKIQNPKVPKQSLIKLFFETTTSSFGQSLQSSRQLFEQAMAVSRGGTSLDGEIIDYRQILDYFSKKRSLKLSLRRYLKLILDLSAQLYNLTVDFVRPAFTKFDKNKDGRLTYPMFKEFIQFLEPTRANWQIFAFFESCRQKTSSPSLDLDTFVAAAIDTDLLSKIMTIE